jgi:glucose-6-phosphate isomerase
MDGAQSVDPHRVHPGNQPSSTILMNRLTPSSLGQLLALYEHKVFAESVLLDINPFDQWGVELGKAVAKSIQDGTRSIDLDGSTEDLIRRAEEMRSNSV